MYVAYLFDFTVNGSVRLATGLLPGMYVITPELCILLYFFAKCFVPYMQFSTGANHDL